jgi:hypothetical protein
MSDPITVTHTPSGSVLHVAEWERKSSWIDLTLIGGTFRLAFLASELEFPPTPRPLPTHVGAIVVKPGTVCFWLLMISGSWLGANNRWLTPSQLLDELGDDWVELVPKTGDGA